VIVGVELMAIGITFPPNRFHVAPPRSSAGVDDPVAHHLGGLRFDGDRVQGNLRDLGG